MNKYCYRVIFNQLKGMPVVVSELNHCNEGKARARRIRLASLFGSVTVSLKPLSLLTGIALGWQLLTPLAQASDIRVDNNAPQSQRPTVTQSGNGVTQVNIQTPTSGGVSHNKFTQFDVSDKGVILNNSNKNVQTELGGYVQGNEFLRGSTGAQVILNEVNAKNASQLNGFIEVAGQKAQVIIANAVGITCNGCGFINANRATLTTGKPLTENGKIRGYEVEGGNITVQGNGLDSSRQDYTDLIAQTVSINSSVWANNANVITGRNKVSADTEQVQALADNRQAKPEFSVDVSAMGGMYAGKIRMVGTEQGVGVRNTGHLGASVDTLALASNGKIVNTGVMESQADIQIKTTQSIDNSGKLLAERSVSLQSGQAIEQKGQITAGQNITVTAANVRQTATGSLIAGSTITGENSGLGSVTINAQQAAQLQGTLRAGDTAEVTSGSIDAGQIKLDSKALNLQAQTGGINLANATLQTSGNATLKAKTTVTTAAATISSNALTLNSQQLDNRGGMLGTKSALMIYTDMLDNTSGQLLSQGDLTLGGQSYPFLNALNNAQGKLTALGDLTVVSHSLTGDGAMQSGQNMALTLYSHWVNQQQIHANGDLTLNATQGLDNHTVITAGSQLLLTTENLHNQTQGEIQGQSTTIHASDILNHGIIDGELTDILASQLQNLDSGRIYGDRVLINAGQLTNQKTDNANFAPVIAGRDLLFIGTANLLNQDHALLLSGGDLTIGAQASLAGVTGYAELLTNHSATIEATSTLTLATRKLDNRDIHLKLSDTPIEVDRVSFHEFEWCQGDGDGGCYGGNNKRYLVQDRNGNEHRQIIDANGNPTGEGYIHYERGHSNRLRFYLSETDRSTKHFYEYFYDKVTYETQIIEQDPAKLRAGQNLIIHADVVTNQDSQIIAGQTLTINAVQFNNNETQGQRWVREQDALGHEGRGAVSYYKSGDWHTSTRGYTYQGINTSEALSLGTLQVIDQAGQSTELDIDGKNSVAALPGILAQYPPVITITLPDNSLYQLRPGNESHYLIETDPRFTNHKKWLSSLDYIDSDSLLKRLGDGYYEQSLIRDQLLTATGRQYLSGYEESNEQYRDLLLAGNLYADTYQLKPGIALTAEQMAALTTNMVWMVNQAVTLPDGHVEVVSVPKLYLVGDQTGLTAQGSIVHADNVVIDTQQDMTNQGRISGDAVKVQSAADINNRGTIVGDRVNLTAAQDVSNIGGTLQVKNELSVSAGRDIIMTTEQHQDGKAGWLDRVATVYVSDSEGKLHLSGQRDITLTAASIISQGDESTLTAGRDITLATQQTGHATNYTRDSSRYDRREWTQEVGTAITTTGDLSMTAGHDVKVRAGDISSQGDISVNAGQDITLTTGESTFDQDARSKWSSSSLFSKTKYTLHGEVHDITAQSSTLSGDNVTLSAGNNILVTGSNVLGEHDVTLKAGQDVTIEAAQEQYYNNLETTKKKSGLMSSGGLGVTYGTLSENLKQTDTKQAYLGSMVGSTEGSVTIESGRDTTVRGSDVIAQKDVSIQGENITIESLDAQTRYKEQYTMEKSGLTIAITGTPSEVYEAAKALDQATQQNNDKIIALESIKTALTITKAIQETQLTNNAGNSTKASVGISVMVGSQKTEREVNQEQHNVVGSGVSAGQNVTLIATGNKDKQGGDITVKGSEVKAGHDATLDANRDINLIAGLNTQHSDREETSKGGAVGIGFAIGGDESGFRFRGNANFSRERENADGSAWSESLISAGNKLDVTAGNNVNLVGSQMQGNRVEANIGHNLNIMSLQDTDNYDYEKVSGSISGSGGVGGGSLNVSLSQTEIDSHWASVTDQAGIVAGSGGYAIYVENNTDLKGAVIASTAEDKRLNSLDTGTISFSDIQNKADFDVKHISISAGTGGGLPGVSPGAVYNKSESDSSVTKSAVEGGTLTVRHQDEQTQDVDSLSRDTANANNPLGQLFDKEKELDKIREVELVSDITNLATNVIDNVNRLEAQKTFNDSLGVKSTDEAIDKMYAEAVAKAKEEDKPIPQREDIAATYSQQIDNYKSPSTGIGGSTTQAINAVSNIIKGIVTGDITGGLAGAGAPYLAEKLKPLEESDPVAHKIAHGILGAVVAELQGGSAVSGGIGAATGETVVKYIIDAMYPGKNASDLNEYEKERVSAVTSLVSGLASTAVGGDVYDAGTAMNASKNAVENNALLSEKLGASVDCKTLSPAACQKAQELMQQVLAKGLPSVEDISDKLKTCVGSECKEVWAEYGAGSEKTYDTIKEMALNGELSREEVAFINNQLANELAVLARSTESNGNLIAGQGLWNLGQLSSFLNIDLRRQELEKEGVVGFDAELQITKELTVVYAIGSVGGFSKLPNAEKGTVGTITNGKPITLENGFYSVDGMKISQSYYDRLWQQGRPAPFIQAKEILNSNPKVIPDPRGAPGYFKYEAGGLEMIYNPTTGQIGHIQPIRTK